MMKRNILFSFLLLVCVGLNGCAMKNADLSNTLPLSTKPSYKSDILFIAYDYGEALAFKAVIPYLKARKTSVDILVFGAAKHALARMPNVIDLSSLLSESPEDKFQTKDIQSLSTQWDTSRTVLLPNKILETVISRLNPKVLVTGMTHAIQAQIANQVALKGGYTVAFYDNFDNPKTQSSIKPWVNTSLGVNELFLPGDYLINPFLAIKSLSGSEITVVGQPALESWKVDISRIDKASVLSALALKESDKIVVYSLGYDKSSLKWFNHFLDVVKQRPDIHFVISLHPKMKGVFPPRLAEKIKSFSNMTIAPKALSSEQLASIAKVMVVYKSTIGVKAAYTGIPVLYVAEEAYDNVLINHKIAMHASTWSEVLNDLHLLLDQQSLSVPTFKSLGMPTQPIIRFDSRLLDIMKNIKRSHRRPVIESHKIEEFKR